MADMLAIPDDLAALPNMPTLPAGSATLLLQMATGVVQAATGQRLVAVTDDPFDIVGTIEPWLDLPQRPVTAVADVTVDSEAVDEDADWRRHGSRLWRSCGWAKCVDEPSRVTGVYSHGYDPTDPGIQLARAATLMLAAGAVDGTAGAVRSEAIDDYQVTYDQMAARLEASPPLLTALRNAYTRRAGLVRLG